MKHQAKCERLQVCWSVAGMSLYGKAKETGV